MARAPKNGGHMMVNMIKWCGVVSGIIVAFHFLAFDLPSILSPRGQCQVDCGMLDLFGSLTENLLYTLILIAVSGAFLVLRPDMARFLVGIVVNALTYFRVFGQEFWIPSGLAWVLGLLIMSVIRMIYLSGPNPLMGMIAKIGFFFISTTAFSTFVVPWLSNRVGFALVNGFLGLGFLLLSGSIATVHAKSLHVSVIGKSIT
jgi:hypothetical protein